MKLTENQLKKIIAEETKKALTEIVPKPIADTAGRLMRLAPWNWYGTRKFGAELLEKNSTARQAFDSSGIERAAAANLNMEEFVAFANKNIKDVKAREEIVAIYGEIYNTSAMRALDMGTDYMMAIGEDLSFLLRMGGDARFPTNPEAVTAFRRAVSRVQAEFRQYGAGARIVATTPEQIATMRVPDEVKENLLLWMKKVRVEPGDAYFSPTVRKWSTPITAEDVGRILGKNHVATVSAIKALGIVAFLVWAVPRVEAKGKQMWQWGFGTAEDAAASGDTGGGGVVPEDE